MKVKAYIEGPYGEPSVNVEDLTYQNFLLISGGIGITPVQSIANELLEQFSRGRPINKVLRGALYAFHLLTVCCSRCHLSCAGSRPRFGLCGRYVRRCVGCGWGAAPRCSADHVLLTAPGSKPSDAAARASVRHRRHTAERRQPG